MTEPADVSTLLPFDFSLPAELYVGHGSRRHSGLRFQSFDTTADAIRHVMETAHRAGEVSTIESGDNRLAMRQITALYNDPSYPLPRIRAALPPEPTTEPQMKSIAIPITRRQASRPAPAPAAATAAAAAPARPVVVPVITADAAALAAAPARHRFKVGARLRMMHGGQSLARPAAYCRVVFLLPYEGGTLLYRVKSEMESFERVVAEADLNPA